MQLDQGDKNGANAAVKSLRLLVGKYVDNKFLSTTQQQDASEWLEKLKATIAEQQNEGLFSSPSIIKTHFQLKFDVTIHCHG